MVAKVPPATYARTKNAVGTHHDAGVKCLTPSASARKSQQKTAAPVNLQRSQKLSTSAARRGREARAAPSRTRSGSWIRVAVNATALLVAPSPQPIAVSRLGPSGAVRGSATIPVPLLAMVRSPLTTHPFPETVFVAGQVIQGNLGSHLVETTVRNWVGRGKSDPMSRILCIVRSLPDRRPATDSGVSTSTAAHDSRHIAGKEEYRMEYHPPWQQVNGNAAEVYERQLVPVMLAPWALKLIDLAEVRPDMHVLDVACGTGVVTRLAAERVGSTGRVVGLDINAAMLSVARRLVPVGAADVEWLEASALEIPLPDAAFDVVLCSMVSSNFRIAQQRCVRCVVSWCPADGWRFASGAGSRGAPGWPPWPRHWSDTWAARRERTGEHRSPSAIRSNSVPWWATLGSATSTSARWWKPPAFRRRRHWLPINSPPPPCRRSAR